MCTALKARQVDKHLYRFSVLHLILINVGPKKSTPVNEKGGILGVALSFGKSVICWLQGLELNRLHLKQSPI